VPCVRIRGRLGRKLVADKPMEYPKRWARIASQPFRGRADDVNVWFGTV